MNSNTLDELSAELLRANLFLTALISGTATSQILRADDWLNGLAQLASNNRGAELRAVIQLAQAQLSKETAAISAV